MTAFISALCAIVSIIVFIISVSVSLRDEPPMVDVGSVFGLCNPGNSDPHKEPKPFVAIYTVQEIKGDEAYVEMRYLLSDGTSHQGHDWRKIRSIQKYDKKLK